MADTLCLSCGRCYGDCPWSERDPETKRIKFQPVPGWTAEATWKRGCGASYHVVACPLYVSDGKDYSAGRGQKPKYDVRAVSDCLRAGMTDREIMRRTGIQSERTLQEYKRRGLWSRNRRGPWSRNIERERNRRSQRDWIGPGQRRKDPWRIGRDPGYRGGGRKQL